MILHVARCDEASVYASQRGKPPFQTAIIGALAISFRLSDDVFLRRKLR